MIGHLRSGLRTFIPREFHPRGKYRDISEHEFGGVMTALGFTAEVSTGTCRESAWFAPMLSGVRLRVLSSVDDRSQRGRAKGKDAIRVLLIDTTTDGIIAYRKTPRIGTYQANLARHVGDLLDEAEGPVVQAAVNRGRCPDCGGLVIERKRRNGGGFLGCTGFRTTGCRHAANLDGTTGRSQRPRPAADETVRCPDCAAPMVRRKGRSRRGRPYDFYGCSNFPGCRGTREAGGRAGAEQTVANVTSKAATVAEAAANRIAGAAW